ncbi:hypothetical protein DITRI_Ditri10aG0084200 [Diplodiscus trichospermus]
MAPSIKNPKKAKRKNKSSKKGDGASTSSPMPAIRPRVWFDIVRDSLGSDRKDFPHTVYFVAGTQAEKASWNSIGVFKLCKVAHHGCVNRIRAMVQNPHICASWADSGHVQVWDFSSHLNALAESENEGLQGASSVFNQAPLVNFRGHKDEVYAIDWSPIVYREGDVLHAFQGTAKTVFIYGSRHLVRHGMLMLLHSLDILQVSKTYKWWSPTEPHAFVSCSVDGTIAIWDIRLGKSPAASFKAHDADVNVISWNRQASCMLASGSDDGTFSIHDFRLLKDGNTVVAHFKYHKYPVTSIEWSPHEASSLAVSSSDNQLTIWDLSLEKDEEEGAEFKAQTREQGQKDLKELHWHAQIPGMIVLTPADGFNILMPSNIQSTIPSNGS